MGSTIIDVAKKCGYSKTTVSRAYAEPDSVSEKAKLKIYAAAKSLNYTPNAIARAMVRQQTENIAFIINEKQSPAVLNPFYSPILEAVMRESARRNYSVFVVTNQDVLLPNGEVYIKKQMDGVIFVGEAGETIIDRLREQNIPVVLLNNVLDMEDLLCITTSHYEGAMSAVDHLYEQKHRKIGLLAGRFSPQVNEARYKGYVDALVRRGLEINPQYILEIDPTLEAGEQAMAHLLQLENRPTAAFCTNDTVAAGAMKGQTIRRNTHCNSHGIDRAKLQFAHASPFGIILNGKEVKRCRSPSSTWAMATPSCFKAPAALPLCWTAGAPQSRSSAGTRTASGRRTTCVEKMSRNWTPC